MLNVKIVAKSVGSFTAVSYVLCVAFGVLAPGWLHASGYWRGVRQSDSATMRT